MCNTIWQNLVLRVAARSPCLDLFVRFRIATYLVQRIIHGGHSFRNQVDSRRIERLHQWPKTLLSIEVYSRSSADALHAVRISCRAYPSICTSGPVPEVRSSSLMHPESIIVSIVIKQIHKVAGTSKGVRDRSGVN